MLFSYTNWNSSEELKMSETNYIGSSNIDSALTKKATAYINTHEMGQKGIF